MIQIASENNHFLQSSFLQPQNLLFLDVPDSELVSYLSECHQLVCREPEILKMIEADVDLQSKEKEIFAPSG